MFITGKGIFRRKMISIMKSWKFFLAVFFVFLIGLFLFPEPEIQAYLFLGQSNMVGYKTDSSRLPKNESVVPNVKIFKNGQWKAYVLEKQVGPELSAVKALAGSDFIVGELGLIKLAFNSTSLFAWSPNWSREKATVTDNARVGPLYEKLLSIVRKAKKAQKTRIRAVFWLQGETDAKYQEAARQYKQNLTEFITSLRRDLGDPELPFILAKIDPPSECCPYRNTVRKAQIDVANELDKVEIVSIDDLSRQADRLHLDEMGQIRLGRRYAGAYLQLEGLK